VAFAYKSEGVGVTLGITSEEPYDSETDGGWHVSADLSVDVGAAVVELQVVQGIQTTADDGTKAGDSSTGLGAKISGDVGELELSAGVDVVLGDLAVGTDDNADVDWEIGGTAGFAFTESTSFDAEFIYSSLSDVGGDIKVKLEDKAGLIEGLSMSLTWGLFDLANGSQAEDAAKTMNDTMDMRVEADLSLVVEALGGKLEPGIDITVDRIDDEDAKVTTELSLVLTEAIPMAELGVKWTSKSLFDESNDDLGVLTAWTTVAY
jgi:hypothetical protein